MLPVSLARADPRGSVAPKATGFGVGGAVGNEVDGGGPQAVGGAGALAHPALSAARMKQTSTGVRICVPDTGHARGLRLPELPIAGSISQARGLAQWRKAVGDRHEGRIPLWN